MNTSELNDLMCEVQCGNEFAFNNLYLGTYKGVFTFIYSYVKNYHTAEDLLQDTFIKVKTKANYYHKGTNARAWIFQIAKNTCLDFLRKEKHRSAEELNEGLVADSGNEVSEFYMHDILNKYLENEDRQIVLLHLEHGYKNREIAEIMNLPMGTILWRYNKAMKTLKEKLREEKT